MAIAASAPSLSAAPAMRVALLVDTSAATTGAIVQIREAVVTFLDALPPEHEVLLASTGRRLQVRVPPTIDRAKLKASAGGLLSENGPTPLMDSLREIDDRFLKKAGERWPVVVVITGDGSENSKDTDDQAFNRWIADAARRGVSANAIVLKGPSNGLPDFVASTLTRVTHGHYASMSNGAGLVAALKQLADQLTADAAARP
jgi:hypothetical protein